VMSLSCLVLRSLNMPHPVLFFSQLLLIIKRFIETFALQREYRV
jgi:hypothetical protein